MKLIDKSAVVAEIERRKEKYITERLKAETINEKNILGARIAMLEEVLVLVNTLEVKEVNFKDVKSIFEGQYLSKDKVVTTIERLQDECEEQGDNNGVELLEKLFNKLDTLEVKEIGDNSFEKFKSLQHISRDLRTTLQDWGYTPNLYHFDGSWHVDWIHCEDGDSIEGFDADTPEEAIDKAYNWFHSTFCNA